MGDYVNERIVRYKKISGSLQFTYTLAPRRNVVSELKNNNKTTVELFELATVYRIITQ